MSETQRRDVPGEIDPTSQTLVGEAQSRLLQQQQLLQQLSGQQQQQLSGQQTTIPPPAGTTDTNGITTSPVIGGGVPTQPEVVHVTPEELSQRTQETPVRFEDVRVLPTTRRQEPVAGGTREEVIGLVEPKQRKVHVVETRPGESIIIKQPPSYFYQTQFFPGMRQRSEKPVRDATIDYLNSFVAKNTHCLLGRTGVKVSRITLGTMNFGKIDPTFGDRPGQLEEAEAHQILDRYVELGGNCIDTADFFPWFGTCGESERIVGSWLERQQRDRIFVITKVRMPVDPNNINSGGLSRAHIIDTVKQSLKRLRTDYVDMLMINGWDPTVSVHELVRNLDELVNNGLVRYIGVCDLKGWQLQKFIDAARILNVHKCVCYEGEYNLLTRGLEWEVIDVCRNERIGFFAYSPFKYGFLTNQYTPETSEPQADSRIESATREPNLVAMAEPFEEMRANPIYAALLDVCERIGRERNLTTSQIAILWSLQRGFVTSCVVGVSSVRELDENMSCLSGEVVLTQRELLELDQASRFPMHYPYTLQLSSVAGHHEIDTRNAITFEQLTFLNEYMPFEQMEQMRLGAHETYHESVSQGFPERQKFGEPSILQQTQSIPETPLEKQQLYGEQRQQEQTLQSGKRLVPPPLTTQEAQEKQTEQTRA